MPPQDAMPTDAKPAGRLTWAAVALVVLLLAGFTAWQWARSGRALFGFRADGGQPYLPPFHLHKTSLDERAFGISVDADEWRLGRLDWLGDEDAVMLRLHRPYGRHAGPLCALVRFDLDTQRSQTLYAVRPHASEALYAGGAPALPRLSALEGHLPLLIGARREQKVWAVSWRNPHAPRRLLFHARSRGGGGAFAGACHAVAMSPSGTALALAVEDAADPGRHYIAERDPRWDDQARIDGRLSTKGAPICAVRYGPQGLWIAFVRNGEYGYELGVVGAACNRPPPAPNDLTRREWVIETSLLGPDAFAFNPARDQLVYAARGLLHWVDLAARTVETHGPAGAQLSHAPWHPSGEFLITMVHGMRIAQIAKLVYAHPDKEPRDLLGAGTRGVRYEAPPPVVVAPSGQWLGRADVHDALFRNLPALINASTPEL